MTKAAMAAYATAARPLDITVFGCTGNAGRGVAFQVLRAKAEAAKGGSGSGSGSRSLSVGLAGRSRDRVESVLKGICDELGVAVEDLKAEIVIADSEDAGSMLDMARSTGVVISCVGPYGRYGEAAVVACIEGGAHYVDITGEVAFVSRMESDHGAAAEKAGVALLPFSGYDCVPAELGMNLVGQALKRKKKEMRSLSLAFRSDGGGFPRGTLETLFDGIEGKVPERREGDARFFSAEYLATAKAALSPFSFLLPSWSGHISSFTAPNFMSVVNVPILCRSAPSLGLGHGFSISDRSAVAAAPSALNLYGLVSTQLYIAALVFGGLATLFPPFRWWARGKLRTYSYKGQADRKVTVDVEGIAGDGGSESASAHLVFPGDPGIYSTGLFAAAVALALREATSPPVDPDGGHAQPNLVPAGFHAPVAALHPCGGGLLVKQLRCLGAEVVVKTSWGEDLDGADL